MFEAASLRNRADTFTEFIKLGKIYYLLTYGKVAFLQTFFRYRSLLMMYSNRLHFDGKRRKNPKNIR